MKKYKKHIGYAIIALFFLSHFCFLAYMESVMVALFIYGLALAMSALLRFAVLLTLADDEPHNEEEELGI